MANDSAEMVPVVEGEVVVPPANMEFLDFDKSVVNPEPDYDPEDDMSRWYGKCVYRDENGNECSCLVVWNKEVKAWVSEVPVPPRACEAVVISRVPVDRVGGFLVYRPQAEYRT